MDKYWKILEQLDKKDSLKKYGKLAIGGLVSILVVVFIWGGRGHSQEPSSPEEAVEASLESQSTSEKSPDKENTQEEIYIDIKGAVHQPGVYRMTAQERVMDALNKAGGLLEEAEDRGVNLSQKLTDQMVIYVPKKGEEVPDFLRGNLVERTGGVAGKESTSQININTADAKQLQNISGIGPKKANDIIQYREQNGRFKSVDELTKVGGIGKKTLEKIRSQIKV